MRFRGRIVAIVGARQVGQKPDLQRRRLHALQPLEGCGKFLGAKTQPVHARVDLDPDDEAMRADELFEQLDLQRVVDHEVEAVPCGFQHMLGGKDPFKQNNRLGDAFGTQCQTLLQPRHRERIGFSQRERRWHESMPIGVRLHDRHDPCASRPLADGSQVVSQRARVDDGPDEPVHLKTPSP